MESLKSRLQMLLQSDCSRNEKLKRVCQLLHDEVPHYNWVGFYFNAPNKPELHLHAYVGAKTDHTIIPHGKGICGQVALSNQTFVVPDVQAQDNYLSCSVETKSEIVVPIFVDGKNIGQIDIDSHQIDPFTEKDTQLLEWLCAEVALLF